MTRPKVAPDDPTRIDPSQPSLTNVTQRDASPAGAGALAPGTRIANRYVVRRFVGSGSPLHAAVGARALDLPVGWTWRS